MNLGLSRVDDNLINLNLQHDWRSRTLRDVGVGGGPLQWARLVGEVQVKFSALTRMPLSLVQLGQSLILYPLNGLTLLPLG
jgi:hypothetical protein